MPPHSSIEYGSEVWECNKNQAGCGYLGVYVINVMHSILCGIGWMLIASILYTQDNRDT